MASLVEIDLDSCLKILQLWFGLIRLLIFVYEMKDDQGFQILDRQMIQKFCFSLSFEHQCHKFLNRESETKYDGHLSDVVATDR